MDYNDHVANIEKRIRDHPHGATTMTPMSDERLAEIDKFVGSKDIAIALALAMPMENVSLVRELLAEVHRLRDVPPEVAATWSYAMSDSKSQQRRKAIQREDDASEPMTDERLREIEAREQAATKGPWEVYELSNEYFADTNHKHGIGSKSKPTYAVAKVEGMGIPSLNDVMFIAHARQDVPDLVAALRHFTTLPPEVAAAMERVRLHVADSNDCFDIAAHFTALFNPTPKVQP